MSRASTLLPLGLSLTLLCWVATCGCGSAQARPKKNNYSMKILHPSGEDVEVIAARTSLTLDGAGKLTRREAKKQKVLTERAIDHFGDPRIHHDVNSQKIEVVRASSFMVDGKEAKTAKNGINETVPQALEKAPAYANRRETVVTHVGFERLATTDFEYVVADTAARPYPLHLELPVVFEGPARSYTVEVTVPSGVRVAYACVNCAVTPSESSARGNRVLTWSFTDVAAYTDDSGGHGIAAGMPRLVISDAASWQDLGKSFAAQIDAALAESTQAKAKALALTEDAPTRAEKIERLTAFVRDGIGMVDYDMTELSWRANSADEVLARGYGHTLDRALLLTALLRAIGVGAEPLLVSRDRDFAAAVPSLAQFAEVWVEVAGQSWLSGHGAVAGARAHLAGRWLFVPKSGVVEQIAAPAASTNLTALTAEIAIADDLTVKGKAELTLTGTANPYVGLRAADEGPDQLASDLAGRLVAGASPSAQTLRSFDDRRTSLAVDLAGGKLDWQAGRFLELALVDGPGFVAGSIADLSRESRTTPLVLASAMVQRSRVTWKLPAGARVRAAPPSIDVDNPAGRFAMSVKVGEGEVTVTRELTIKDGWITPANYAALRELLFAARPGQLLVVERDLP